MSMVDITGLSRAEVLAALFNATAPGGMGFLQAGFGPEVMTVEYAEQVLEASRDQYFDYLYGRCLKTDLSNDTEFDSWGFDRDNGGPGAAQRVIDNLRATRDVNNADAQQARGLKLADNAELTLSMTNEPTTVKGNVFNLGMRDVKAPVTQAVQNALRRKK